LDRGVKKIVLGIGGSATNDAALGAAQALGYRFLGEQQEVITPVGQNLSLVRSIDSRDVHPRLKKVSITAICDVTNPFYGSNGAAYVYAPQKGATEKEIALLDKGLQNMAMVFEQHFKTDLQTVAGAGAGGGFAGGAKVLFNAALEPGIKTLFELISIETLVKQTDLIITGEGKIDNQTLQGKLIAGISALARKHNKRLWIVVGSSELSNEEVSTLHAERTLSLSDFAGSVENAMQHTASKLFELAKLQNLN
jgi:glycerate 2-kinase